MSDYSFWEVLWWMIAFFAFVIWFWLLITVFGDLFRRHDIGGGGKTLWIIFIILLPFLGVFIYLISQGKGMAERNMASMQAAQAQQADYIKSVASWAARLTRSTRRSSCSTPAPSRRPSSTPSRPRRSLHKAHLVPGGHLRPPRN